MQTLSSDDAGTTTQSTRQKRYAEMFCRSALSTGSTMLSIPINHFIISYLRHFLVHAFVLEGVVHRLCLSFVSSMFPFHKMQYKVFAQPRSHNEWSHTFCPRWDSTIGAKTEELPKLGDQLPSFLSEQVVQTLKTYVKVNKALRHQTTYIHDIKNRRFPLISRSHFYPFALASSPQPGPR